MIERFEDIECVRYRLNGVPHRTNGPAFEWLNGDWSWALHGKIHRYYGLAGSNAMIDIFHESRKIKFWVLHGERVR
jgi:hypothetical protein